MPQRKWSYNKWNVLYFRLKHFDYSTINYVLDKTGYNSLIEYEQMCLNTDMFIHKIEIDNGTIIPINCNIDYKKYCVFELSIHNLNDEARHYIMTNYIHMTQIEYELKHPERNKIFICVPYKNEQFKLASTEESEIQMDRPIETKDLKLKGWTFIKNKQTNNSYILTPPKKIQLVKDGMVCWGKYDLYTTPTTWHLELEGINRPIYYNNNLGAWIVSLRYRSQLVDAGAIEV